MNGLFVLLPNRPGQVTPDWSTGEETKPKMVMLYPCIKTTSLPQGIPCFVGQLSAIHRHWPQDPDTNKSFYAQSGKVTTRYRDGTDIRLQVRKWTLTLRHALFDTDDFDNRQYL